MQSHDAVPPISELERSVRAALAGTSLSIPRPQADLQIPFKLERLIPDSVRARLRPAAVLAPIVRRGDELSMLLTVRASHLRSHKGQISFPGGGSDEGDRDAVDTALRESEEEIGLDRGCVEVIGFLDDYPTTSRYLVTPVVGLIDGEPDLRIDDNEVAEIFEVPLPVVLDPASYARRLMSRDGLNLPFFELLWRHYRIWGATAGMLWNFTQKLREP